MDFYLTIIHQCSLSIEANKSSRVILRGEYQELQNNRVKHKNKDAIVR